MKKFLLLSLTFSFCIFADAQIPSGYYNSANGLNCQPLKTALKSITNNATVISYTPGVWQAYQYTDIKPGTGNLIWDIYTDDNNPDVPETFNFIYGSVNVGGNQCGNYNSEGDCYNREHTTPQSWFNEQPPMESDVHMLLPTDGWINNQRSNYPYGNVSIANYTSIDNGSKRGTGTAANYGYSGTVFMPFSAFRGDLARIALYMATRYEDQMIDNDWAGNSPEANESMLSITDEPNAAMRRLQIYDDWQLKVFFDWMAADPVSQKEIDRNNAIYYQSGQANRNPFVDHPEYAALIWQCTGIVPVNVYNFTAVKNSRGVLVEWDATQETNFKKYTVERSRDGINYYSVGEIEGDNRGHYYLYDEDLPAGSVLYYRLKMTDIDGSARYSTVQIVRINNSVADISVYPNPVQQFLKLKINRPLTGTSTIVITDASGREVFVSSILAGDWLRQIDVSKLSSGKYFLRVINSETVLNGAFNILR